MANRRLRQPQFPRKTGQILEFEGHYYSVPHPLIHEKVELRITAETIEAFHKGTRVSVHPRSRWRGRHSTLSDHMPKAHQKQLEWTPSRLTHWAGTIGPNTQRLVEAILADRPHPEMGYRSCLGILRLSRRCPVTRLEAACARALSAGARSYRHVDSILKKGLDTLPAPDPGPAVASPPLSHENVRGSDYYQ